MISHEFQLQLEGRLKNFQNKMKMLMSLRVFKV